MLCSFENSAPGKERTAAPIEEGPLEVETCLLDRVEQKALLCWEGQQREREREGWEFRVKVPDSPAGRVSGELGASLPSESPGGTQGSQGPMVSVAGSPGRGDSGRGSQPEPRCRGRAVGEGPGGIQKVPDPMQSDERTSEGRSQLRLDREASERDHVS